MAPSKYVYTGKKDAKSRMIFRGPKGGLFVRGPSGKKIPPATGPARAKSPMRRR